MRGEDLDDDSILAGWIGPITWAKVVLALVLVIAVLICCGINGGRPEFWEFVNG